MKGQRILANIVVLVGIFTLILGFSGPSVYAAEDKELVFVGWGGTWDETIKKCFLAPFEQETGVKVIVTGPFNEGKLKAMVQTGNVEWDVITIGYVRAAPGIKEGLYEPIDYNIVDKKGMFPSHVQKYMAGGDIESINLGYRTDVYGAKPPSGWKDFWDLKKFPGPRGLTKKPWYTMEAALLADGVPPDKLYPLDVERAFASLDKIKPHIVWWTSGAQCQNLIKEREVDMIAGYGGRLAVLANRGDPVELVWNQHLQYLSGWLVIKNAPHKKAAMQFINVTTRPKLQAMYASETFYGYANPEALKHIDKKVLKYLPSTPEHLKTGVDLDWKYWAENGTQLSEKFEAWLMK